MPTVRSNEMEQILGKRISSARRKAGLTQEMLGIILECSFQQIQKYEKGTNRVAASTLLRISAATRQPVHWFYEDLDGVAGARSLPPVHPDMSLSLARIEGKPVATALRKLVEEIARLAH